MKFDAAAAYDANTDASSEQQPAQQEASAMQIPPEVVEQLQQLKAAGNMEALGQVVAQLLP